MNLTFSIKSKKVFNMFGADLAAAATALCSFMPFCA